MAPTGKTLQGLLERLTKAEKEIEKIKKIEEKIGELEKEMAKVKDDAGSMDARLARLHPGIYK